jgi:hypothetical protein
MIFRVLVGKKRDLALISKHKWEPGSAGVMLRDGVGVHLGVGENLFYTSVFQIPHSEFSTFTTAICSVYS